MYGLHVGFQELLEEEEKGGCIIKMTIESGIYWLTILLVILCTTLLILIIERWVNRSPYSPVNYAITGNPSAGAAFLGSYKSISSLSQKQEEDLYY